MSTLDRADNRCTADGAMKAGAIDGQDDAVGVYLTDEVFLYRVVGLVGSRVREIVELEDCYGLDVVRVPLRDLDALRAVTPTRADG